MRSGIQNRILSERISVELASGGIAGAEHNRVGRDVERGVARHLTVEERIARVDERGHLRIVAVAAAAGAHVVDAVFI